MRKLVASLALVIISAAWGTTAGAELTYDKAANTILVAGFPLDKPAALADVLKADQAGGWNVVKHDQATDTYVISADLAIGLSDGSDTVLAIGSANHPNQTLILKGDLRVNAPKEKSYMLYTGSNALTIGVPDNPQIKPTVKFDCSEDGEYTFSIGLGTTVQLYNATLTAATLDGKHRPHWRGSPGSPGRFEMINSVLSGFAWLGIQTSEATVRGCVFEQIGTVLGNGAQWAENCVFRNCGAALSDGGCLDCTVVNCRFENNKQNWILRHTARGIRAVDCFFGESEVREVMCQRWKNPQTGGWQYPTFFAQRHIVVSVKDAAGKPVADAKVTVANEQGDPSAVAHGVALTDQEGKTPAPGSGNALLLTDYLYRASEDPKNPIEKRYTYTVTVTAPNYASAKVTGIDPDETWVVKEIIIKKK